MYRSGATRDNYCAINVQIDQGTVQGCFLALKDSRDPSVLKLLGCLRDAEDSIENPEDRAYREAVNDVDAVQSDDNFDFDDIPAVSASDDGAYVGVWVWVPKSLANLPEDEDGE